MATFSFPNSPSSGTKYKTETRKVNVPYQKKKVAVSKVFEGKKRITGLTYNPGSSSSVMGFSGIPTGGKIGLQKERVWKEVKGKSGKWESPDKERGRSSEDKVTGSNVEEGNIVESNPKGLPAPEPEIIDGEVIPNSISGGGRRAIAAPPKAIEAPKSKQFGQINSGPNPALEAANRQVFFSGPSKPGKSSASIAGNKISWSDMKSGRFAGTTNTRSSMKALGAEKDLNPTTATSNKNRPSTVMSNNPAAKAAFLNSPEVQSVQPSRVTGPQFNQG
jgi:hypothetical protein